MEKIYIKKLISTGDMDVLTREKDVAIYSDPKLYQIFRVTDMEEIKVTVKIEKK